MFDVSKNPINIKPPSAGKPAFFVALAAFVAFIVFSSYFTVDQGERGIVLRFGAFQRIAEPGLNFKSPYLNQHIRLVCRRRYRIFSYRLTRVISNQRLSMFQSTGMHKSQNYRRSIRNLVLCHR